MAGVGDLIDRLEPVVLAVDCADLYAPTENRGKRLTNQALTNGIDIGEDDQANIRLIEPLAASSKSETVPSKGFEPSTYRLGGGCSSPELRGRT